MDMVEVIGIVLSVVAIAAVLLVLLSPPRIG
jgi:hypothetical protein